MSTLVTVTLAFEIPRLTANQMLTKSAAPGGDELLLPAPRQFVTFWWFFSQRLSLAN